MVLYGPAFFQAHGEVDEAGIRELRLDQREPGALQSQGEDLVIEDRRPIRLGVAHRAFICGRMINPRRSANHLSVMPFATTL